MKRINADKPHLWKADIAASVDQFNQWFMRFAPEAFRSTRVATTQRVKDALLATGDLQRVTPAILRDNPGAIATLRMCTAPPLAVDRVVGLAAVTTDLPAPLPLPPPNLLEIISNSPTETPHTRRRSHCAVVGLAGGASTGRALPRPRHESYYHTENVSTGTAHAAVAGRPHLWLSHWSLRPVRGVNTQTSAQRYSRAATAPNKA